LLPVRASKKREAGKQWLAGFAFALVVGVVANYFWYSSIQTQIETVKKDIAHDEKENAALEKTIGEVKDIKSEKDVIRQKLATLAKLKTGRSGPVRMLDELATVIPPKVWLMSWDEQAGAVTIQ